MIDFKYSGGANCMHGPLAKGASCYRGLTRAAAAAILRSRLRESAGLGSSSSLVVDKADLLLRCFLFI
jgi:hypothetical protein